MNKIIFLFGTFLLSLSIVIAQASECSVDYSLALTQTEEACNATSRNQACYGNNTVNIIPFDPTTPIQFDTPGDIADVGIIRRLSLSALDEASGEWGIAMMRLLANLSPSQPNDITVLFFGDVSIESATKTTSWLPVSTIIHANIRHIASESSTVVWSVPESTELNAIGRTEDSRWVQVLDNEANQAGWILAELLEEFDTTSLPVVESTAPYFGPMQAFYFSTGSRSCSNVPLDGILIQTPEGIGRVTIWVNEVTVDFMDQAGSTALLHTSDENTMDIQMLEGYAYVSTDNEGYIAVAGSTVAVEYGDGGPNMGIPEPSNAYSSVDTLSIVPRPVNESNPTTTDQIAQANGLTPNQYEEVVVHGYVVSTPEPVVSNTDTSQQNIVLSNDSSSNSNNTGSSNNNQNSGNNSNGNSSSGSSGGDSGSSSSGGDSGGGDSSGGDTSGGSSGGDSGGGDDDDDDGGGGLLGLVGGIVGGLLGG